MDNPLFTIRNMIRKNPSKGYTEYGYRGLEELKQKDELIKQLKERIEDLEKRIQPQHNRIGI